MTVRGSRTLIVNALARVEGEGGMRVRVRDGGVADVELSIYEPPRFFEAFLRGRHCTELPDITARICGICPVAYQMSACLAVERLSGVMVDGPIAHLRRLLYCGEWMESHALHIHLLHAPDFLGYESAIAMAKDHRDVIERGLRLKKAGNAIMTLLGGRSVHPVNVRLGGFYRTPTRRELNSLLDITRWARDDAAATVTWAAGLDFPDFEQEYVFVALQDPNVYPILEGQVATSDGVEFAAEEFDEHIVEEQVPYSTALHARLRAGQTYLAGPLARYALNSERLSPLAREAAAQAGLPAVCRNPFRSILVRAVEVLYACDEAVRLIESYEEPDLPFVDVAPRVGVGHAVTEAPRGLLYHRYRLDRDGIVEDARIVPPTAQNQARIEQDLRVFVPPRLHLPNEYLTTQCEQMIRNYDPCISCATHFLTTEVVWA
ncbi:MAG: Ni/Fe hydrogenase subunit alpha [Pseudonocardiaceae bacterium]